MRKKCEFCSVKIENTYRLKWEQCLKIIRNNVTEEVYNAFFATMVFEQYSDAGRTLLIQLPSQFIYEYIEEHFAKLMNAVLRRVFQTEVILKYRVKLGEKADLGVMQPNRVPSIPQANIKRRPNETPNAIETHTDDEIDSQLSREYTFDNFIEGDANRAARTIGYTVAQNPNSRQFNPLFIYGPSGCGKTHLINAIGVRTKELYPEKRVLYVSARLFQAQFVDARIKNEINDFIAFYQRIDLLIVDDIQEWETAPKTVDAFYHIFNSLHRNGKRIVLASDRPPVALTWLTDRLITRFSWGPTLEIGKPDQQLCRNILLAKIKRDGLDIPEDVVEFIACTANGSVRHLEGIINSLMAYAIAYNHTDIDMSLAERVVKRSVKVDETPITIDDILSKVAEAYGVTEEAIIGKSRQKNIAEARQTVVYLVQKHTKMPAQRIGKLLGNRNHSTILHSCSQAEKKLGCDADYANRVEEIEKSFSLK